jgi:hypothetical protein
MTLRPGRRPWFSPIASPATPHETGAAWLPGLLVEVNPRLLLGRISIMTEMASLTPGQAGERRSGGSFFPGFYVESLDRAVQALTRAGAPILTRHEQMPWGCRVVAEDPDGRAVEVNQRGHCPSP